jgi:palmitoyltransferase ZDHHC9/14/18
MEENDKLIAGNMNFFCDNKRVYTKSIQNCGGGIMTVLLIFVPTLLFYIFVPGNFINNASIAIIYIFSLVTLILTLYTWFDAATTSPGYLRQNTHSEEEFNKTEPTITLKDKQISLKFCTTCKAIRDVRSMHCNICGYCIKRHDHHCVFVANCVGENNTDKFVYFLLSVVAHSLTIMIPSILNISHAQVLNDKIYYNISLFLAIYSGLFFVAILFFLIFHTYLICKNRTTNEYIRNQYGDDLFDKGCGENFREVFSNKNNIV